MPELFVAGVSLSDNPKDISPQGLEMIKNAPVLIGEERRCAMRLIKASGAEDEKRLYFLNEHSSDADRKEALQAVLSVERAVFFSDAGTPCISDPDYKFIKMCRDSGVVIKSLPGPSSIVAAVSVSGIEARQFFFAGFPPKNGSDRIRFFRNILNSQYTTVFMERPYALESTLKDMSQWDRRISVSINMGCSDEQTLYGKPTELIDRVTGIKAPFVVVVPPMGKKKFKKVKTG